MNAPNTTSPHVSPPKDPTLMFLAETAQDAEPLERTFKQILDQHDPESASDDMIYVERFPNNVQLPDSAPKPANVDRTQTHEIAQEIVKQIEVSQSEHRSEARISVEVLGATLWIRVKQRTRGVDVTLRTKDGDLKKHLRSTKSELSETLDANDVEIRRLKIV